MTTTKKDDGGASFTIPAELVARLGGTAKLDAFVEAIKQADAASKTPEALAEAIRGHMRAMLAQRKRT